MPLARRDRPSCAGFSDAGMTVLTTRAEAGVGEAPRHEVAGDWALTAQRALWRLCDAAAIRVMSVRSGGDCRRLLRVRMRSIWPPKAAARTKFCAHQMVRAEIGTSGSVAGR